MGKAKDEFREVERFEIDLGGPDGNAYALLGKAKRLCLQCGKDWESIRAEMKAGNYHELVEVFEREFGDYVTIYK